MAVYLLTPDDGTLDTLLVYHDVIHIFMFAPELPGALELADKIDQLGSVPAAGHSSAQDTHIRAAMKHGLQHVTHIWSAMSSVVREGPWRKPGLLEAALTFTWMNILALNRHIQPVFHSS